MQKKLLVLVMLVGLLSVFTGCDMAMDTASVSSRKVTTTDSDVTESTSSKPVSFTATVPMFQDYSTLDTLDMGNSDHHKTISETLYSYMDLSDYGYGVLGGFVDSDWDLFNGKFVVMNNVTNYNADEETGEISGSNHSVIELYDLTTGALVATLEANGTVDGTMFGAEISMNWVMKDNIDDANARGKISGQFIWYVIDPTTGGISETYIPNGTFTLSGTYN